MKKIDVRFLVDYFCFTISRSDFFSVEADEQFIFERILGKLFLGGLDYQLRRSFYGYNVTQMSCGICICYGGRDDIYIQMSGQGCRAFESLHPGLTWEKYISYLQLTYTSFHVSRLDIACDTFDLLRLDKIQRYTMEHRFISKWRTFLCQIGSNENSVIWGSSASDFRCRIYDKSQERREKTGSDEVPENWVRVEFQLRNDRAQSFLHSWFCLGDLSECFLGVLRNQLIYYSKFDGVHYDRVEIVSWWERLLGAAGRVKMAYCGGLEYNLESLKDYVVRQAGGAVRAYVELYGVQKLVDEVKYHPMNQKQSDLVGRFKTL